MYRKKCVGVRSFLSELSIKIQSKVHEISAPVANHPELLIIVRNSIEKSMDSTSYRMLADMLPSRAATIDVFMKYAPIACVVSTKLPQRTSLRAHVRTRPDLSISSRRSVYDCRHSLSYSMSALRR